MLRPMYSAAALLPLRVRRRARLATADGSSSGKGEEVRSRRRERFANAQRAEPMVAATKPMGPPATAGGAVSFGDVESLSTEELRAEVERLKRLVQEEGAFLLKRKSGVVIQSLDDVDEAYPSRSATPSDEDYG